MPPLVGSSFNPISLLDLGTYAAGTRRLSLNASIGLFGHLATRSMGNLFGDLMGQMLFPALRLERNFIRGPGPDG